MGSDIIRVVAQHMARSAKSVEMTITLRQFVKVINVTPVLVDISQIKNKGKRFHKVNEQKDEDINDLADQVQSLFYNDIHFNSMNTRMHTSIECMTPNGRTSTQTFKIGTGAYGNLRSISMFTKLFP